MKNSRTSIIVPIGAVVLAFLSVMNSACGHAASGDREFLTLKRDLVISDRNAGKDGLLARIGVVQADDNGTIYVLDDKDDKVKVFGADGSFIRNLGKKGQGPGEFRTPAGLFIEKDGTISVFDLANGRMTGFSSEGAFIRELDLRSLGQFVAPEAESDEAFYGIRMDMEGRNLLTIELVRFDKKTRTVSVLSKAGSANTLPKQEPLLDRFILRTRSDGGRIWGYTKDYELFLESPSGQRTGTITHKSPRLRVTEEDKDKMIKMMFPGKTQVPNDIELVWPEYYSPVLNMVLDDRDWLYVRTFEKDEAGRSKYDVFDAGGVYRGSFHSDRSIHCIKKGRCYVSTEDEDGNPVIERYVMTPAK